MKINNYSRIYQLSCYLHRYIGLILAIFIAWMSISGILLNHSKDLNLNNHFLEESIIAPTKGFKAKAAWITHIENSLYFDTKDLKVQCGNLAGINENQFITIACGDQLILLTEKGEVIEQLSTNLPPGKIIAINKAQPIIIKTTEKTVSFDNNFLNWKSIPHKETIWSKPQEIPPTVQNKLSQITTKKTSYETLILTLHSGHIMNSFGIIIWDILAILTLLLVITGLIKWAVSRKAHNLHG